MKSLVSVAGANKSCELIPLSSKLMNKEGDSTDTVFQ